MKLPILLLCCVGTAGWPSKLSRRQRQHARLPAGYRPLLGCHDMAGVTLERWQWCVLIVEGVGMTIGVLLTGFEGTGRGGAAFLVGANLAPVLADHVPERWFEIPR